MAVRRQALVLLLLLTCMIPALILRVVGELLCWRAERDQAVKLDTAAVVVRLISGLLCAAAIRHQGKRRAGDVRPPRWLRLAALFEMLLYAVSYLPHLLKTFILNDQATLAGLLILCIDLRPGSTLSLLLPVSCIADYVGVVAASSLLCWTALEFPRSGPLLLVCAANSAVGITVALRQGVMAVSVRGFLWGLVLSSLAQLAHSLWLLLLLLLAADAADTPAVIEPAVCNRARGPVASTKIQALRARAQGCVDPRPDAMGFFKLDRRWLLELLGAAFNLGVVLYQLTRPLSETDARRALLLKTDRAKGHCGPRLGCAF
ncbi:uncharacterized protein LOC119401325 [Rhipicephalus sanguineus]|uniref:uncharacterized protein LOC119401325 n=1 Tax=Rhipicephalus sanguineus TaxID=34632 RepID=UPI0018947A1A|nr:uncharacterized protein LOC119401325 [Rhipicephalus sanguineus]